ncbi:RloB family protein [Saccharothrix sp. BKS2]|uniref:RloB family protein n=1 Tax=Saccharothrix sp. BKS2 TaxID=3064400 RepID=UPI0039E99674
MMARRENSQRRSSRTVPVRRRNVLVVSGGQKTESQYFTGLRLTRRVPITVKCKVDAPENLVRYAANLRDRYREEFDAVWCVVDVDNFDIPPAVRLADKVRVNLAVSNPCFELWLLLHFADHRAHVADYRAARDLVAKHVPGYDKELDYAAFDANVERAVARAAALGPDNPTTAVGRLVEAVLQR